MGDTLDDDVSDWAHHVWGMRLKMMSMIGPITFGDALDDVNGWPHHVWEISLMKMVGSITFGYTLDDDVNYFASFTNWAW